MISQTTINWPALLSLTKAINVHVQSDKLDSNTYCLLMKKLFSNWESTLYFSNVIKVNDPEEVVRWSQLVDVLYNREGNLCFLHGSFKQWVTFLSYIFTYYACINKVYQQCVIIAVEFKNFGLYDLEISNNNNENKVIKYSIKQNS